MNRKTEIYTWRLSPAMKASLEEAARREGRTIAQLLDEIVGERLAAAEGQAGTEADRQRRLHARAARFAGCLSGVDPQRGERAGALVRVGLRRRRQGAV